MGEYRLPHDTTAAEKARTRLEEELSSVLPPPRIEDSRLMVTELVSNAVRHAPPEPEGGIVLEIEREPGVVRIVVRDGGKHMDPDEPSFHTHSDGHYGLFVVDTLANQWAFRSTGTKGSGSRSRPG